MLLNKSLGFYRRMHGSTPDAEFQIRFEAFSSDLLNGCANEGGEKISEILILWSAPIYISMPIPALCFRGKLWMQLIQRSHSSLNIVNCFHSKTSQTDYNLGTSKDDDGAIFIALRLLPR